MFILLDEKEPKNQGQNHRPSARPPKRLTFKSGSDFCKVKRKRPSLKVKRLVVPWATAPPRFGRALAPSPVKGRRSRTRCPLFSLSPLTTHSRPKPSSRAQTRDLLHRQRTTHPSSSLCVSLSKQACHPYAGLRGAWDLCLRLAFSPSFSLERKVSEKFKAASIGPPRGCLNT